MRLVVALVLIAFAKSALSSGCFGTPNPLNNTLFNISYFFAPSQVDCFQYIAPVGQTSVSLKFYPGSLFSEANITITNADLSSTLTRMWEGQTLLIMGLTTKDFTQSPYLNVIVNSTSSYSIQMCTAGNSSYSCTPVCPNDCSSGQGTCIVSTGTCSCYALYEGADCSECPTCKQLAKWLFGSLALCLLVTCGIPVAVIVIIAVLIACSCRNRSRSYVVLPSNPPPTVYYASPPVYASPPAPAPYKSV